MWSSGAENAETCRNIGMNESACNDAAWAGKGCFYDDVDGCVYGYFGRQDPMANIIARIARAIDGYKLDQE